MPMWRCPHCGTPQSETSRCWVCKRSSTSCGTCRHFRRSIAGHLGYCGLDPRRLPLRGDEMRGCWEAAPVTEAAQPDPVRIIRPLARAPARGGFEAPVAGAARASSSTTQTGRLDFIPIGPAPRKRARRPARPRSTAAGAAPDPVLGFWGEEA